MEKQLKDLLEKQKKAEPEEEPSSLMGSGLGGRLMIGGPG
jgi:clathrin heavy chain